MDRNQIIKQLHARVNVNGHIIGAAVGSGMTAMLTIQGGADFILALSAGQLRMMGRSSYASYLCYFNSNKSVLEMGKKELLTIIQDVPVLLGLYASDPTINLYDFLKEVKGSGFSGIVNYPTVSLIDGDFRNAIEEEGNTYEREIEAIHLAHYLDLFTVAFVTNEDEAEKMLEAGADIICIHLGLTKGGFLGAKKYISMNTAKNIIDRVCTVCDKINPNVIKMVYSGPANTPIDMQYLYKNTECQGYIGGSTFERIPIEQAVVNTTKAFKSAGTFDNEKLFTKIVNGDWNTRDYVQFVKEYIDEYYMNEIKLGDIALVIHLSSSYLSTKFKREEGISFTEYLVRFRVNKAKELLMKKNISCKEVAEMVGYKNYAQFSRIFKKHIGMTPSSYQKKYMEDV